MKHTFATVIRNQMSQRTLLSLDSNELHEFILILFDFFTKANPSDLNIYLGKPKLNSKTLTNQYILKMVSRMLHTYYLHWKKFLENTIFESHDAFTQY